MKITHRFYLKFTGLIMVVLSFLPANKALACALAKEQKTTRIQGESSKFSKKPPYHKKLIQILSAGLGVLCVVFIAYKMAYSQETQLKNGNTLTAKYYRKYQTFITNRPIILEAGWG